jgi:predicted N-acetyltransferase YhbS
MSTEIRGLKETELAAHADLVHRSYYEYVESGERTFLADPEWWLKAAQADPYYQPEQTRVMVLDGQLVASVTNYTRDVFADGRLAKVSCIGSVCTHPDFRRRGLVRQVLAESIAWMEQAGYNWSFLFGKEEVYGGSGWTIVTALEMVADLRLRSDAPAAATVRPVDPASDVPALVAIYEYFNRTMTGPIVRSEAYWRQKVLAGRWGAPPPFFMVELDGHPVGYFAGADAHVREVGWVSEPAELFAAMLRQWPDQAIRFHCYTSDMVRYLREITDVPSGGSHFGTVTLPETYKGLWRYIGDTCRCFGEMNDTPGLRRFLRQHEYNFWPADSF